MNPARPIGTPRALWILARLSLRRQLNQWQSITLNRLSALEKAPPSQKTVFPN